MGAQLSTGGDDTAADGASAPLSTTATTTTTQTAAASASSSSSSTTTPVKILYGTAFGRARSLAEQLQETLKKRMNVDATVRSMDAVEPEDLAAGEQFVVMIVSTHDGLPPDNVSEPNK
jgi:sulfite reductase alpha subunit-like flavoprotein